MRCPSACTLTSPTTALLVTVSSSSAPITSGRLSPGASAASSRRSSRCTTSTAGRLVIGAEELLTVTKSAVVGDVDVQADGQRIGALRPGRAITVGLHGDEVHLAMFPEASFFRRYREKFGRP